MKETLGFIIFWILFILVPLFIYHHIKKMNRKRKTYKGKVDFFNVKGFKIYLHESNLQKVWKAISLEKDSLYNENTVELDSTHDYFSSRIYVDENEYGRIPSEKMKLRFIKTYNYLLSIYKNSKNDFIREYYNFELNNEEAIEESKNILFYYFNVHKLGEISETRNGLETDNLNLQDKEIETSEDKFYLVVNLKKLTFQINIEKIKKIEGNMDDLKIYGDNFKYRFRKKEIIILDNE